MNAYKTSYEEDVEILKKDDADRGLTNQERNCVLLKKGEKEILMFIKDTAEAFIKMCSMTKKEAQQFFNEHPLSSKWFVYFKDF